MENKLGDLSHLKYVVSKTNEGNSKESYDKKEDCTTCQAKIKSGKRKGEKCEKKVKHKMKYCGRHQPKRKYFLTKIEQ